MNDVAVMMVAAEPSGDALGAALAGALRGRLGAGLHLSGVGGPLMAAEGVASAFDIAPLSVLGVLDALRAYPLVRRRAREVGQMAARERPDVAVLIDSWGFTLRAAHAIRGAAPGTTIVKYVGPQVWATRPGRARTLARAVDHLLTIHSFDAPWFERAGLATTFVGNPVFTRGLHDPDPGGFRRSVGAAIDDPLLVVAPGSRRGEVDRLLGPFGDAVAILAGRRARLKVVVLAAAQVASEVERRVAAWSVPVTVARGDGVQAAAMAAATAALACSGTVTTELALAGAPVVVAYRLDALTYPIAKLLLRTPHITLLNVAAGREIAPEYLQGACTGPNLAAALAPLLDDPECRSARVAAQRAALDLMRGGVADPSAAAADAVIASLRSAAQPRASSAL